MHQPSTDETQAEEPVYLRFPWGDVLVEEALVGSREQAYLKWLTRKASSGKLQYLERVLGNKPHRTKASYRGHRPLSNNQQRRSRARNHFAPSVQTRLAV